MPRGRNPTTILLEYEQPLSQEDLRNVKLTTTELVRLGVHEDDLPSTRRFCAKYRLIRNEMVCSTCHNNMRLVTDATRFPTDIVKWNCSTCHSSKSIRDGSFFSRSHLKLWQLIRILHWWGMDVSNKIVMEETGVSETTLIDWNNFIRDVCFEYMTNHMVPIGGLDDNGEPHVVEVDESVFFKTKYNVGQRRELHWVIGGIQRGDHTKCFMTVVPDRSANTLIPIINRYILPHTTICTDGWRSYNDIVRQGGQNYEHLVVNHCYNFIDPQNNEAHTQNVESMWSRVKAKYRRMKGTSQEHFDTYLCEYFFRLHFPYPVTFGNLLHYVSEMYAFGQ